MIAPTLASLGRKPDLAYRPGEVPRACARCGVELLDLTRPLCGMCAAGQEPAAPAGQYCRTHRTCDGIVCDGPPAAVVVIAASLAELDGQREETP